MHIAHIQTLSDKALGCYKESKTKLFYNKNLIIMYTVLWSLFYKYNFSLISETLTFKLDTKLGRYYVCRSTSVEGKL